MASLAEVSELIRKNDTKIIGNQDEQTDALQSIDFHIKKFLAIQERSRLDDLEDRRERRRVTGTAAAAGAAAGSGGGGGRGGIVPVPLGGIPGLGTAAKIAALLAGLPLAVKAIRGLANQTSRMAGTERGVALDSNDILRKQLDDLKKTFNTERKALEADIKRLRTDLTSARASENKLTRELDASKANARATLKTELEAAAAKRAQLETELKTARANLVDAKADLAEAKVTLKETKAAGKLKTDQLNNQVESLRTRVAELSNNAAARARIGGATNTSIPSAGEVIGYTNSRGQNKTATVTGDKVAPGKIGVTDGKTNFAIDAESLNNVPDSISSARRPSGGAKVLDKGLLVGSAATGDPLAGAEIAARVTKANTTGAVSRSAGSIARILGSGTLLTLTGIFGYSTATGMGEDGFATDTITGTVAAKIFRFLKAVQRNAPVAEILKAKNAIFSDGFTSETYMKALMASPPEGLGMNKDQATDVYAIITATNPELGSVLKKFYTERNAKFAEGQAEFDRLGLARKVGPNKEMQEKARTKYAMEYAGITGIAAERARGEGIGNSIASFFAGDRTATASDVIATKNKMARIMELEAGNLTGGSQQGAGGSTVIGSVGDTTVNNSSPQSIVIGNGGATDTGSSHDMNGSSGNSMTMQ